MKKALFFAIALFVVLSAVAGSPQRAVAAPDSMVVVYVSVPDDWENPCLWAWDNAGNGAFASWPGGEAEPDPNNAGWYYCYLPNWAVNIIVNANDGTVQTDALESQGGNIWITVSSPEEAEISYDALTTGSAPDYIEKITVYARVPADWDSPCLWAWLDPDGTNAFAAWPGGEMKDSGDWYSVKVPSWINSVIINANEGAVQTSDYKDLEQGNDLWVVVADDLSAEVYYENPDLIVPDITVRAAVPAGWENPCLWAWLDPDGTNAFASWPGEPLEKNGDWYEIKVPGWVNSFIVNANGGSVQTGDMKGLDTGKDIWIIVTDSDNFEYDYSELTPPAAPDIAQPPAEDASPSQQQPQTSIPEQSPSSAPQNAPQPEADTGGSPVLWIVLGVVVVVIIVVVVVVIAKKRKSK